MKEPAENLPPGLITAVRMPIPRARRNFHETLSSRSRNLKDIGALALQVKGLYCVDQIFVDTQDKCHGSAETPGTTSEAPMQKPLATKTK